MSEMSSGCKSNKNPKLFKFSLSGSRFFFLFFQEVDDRGSLQFPAPCCSKQTLTDLVIVLPTFQSNS